MSCFQKWSPVNHGGRRDLHSSNTLTRLAASVTSHFTMCTRHFCSVSCFSISATAGVMFPLRERNNKLRAPLDTIHLAILRPNPPRPPLRTYVASGLKVNGVCCSGTIGTTSSPCGTNTILPVPRPDCRVWKPSISFDSGETVVGFAVLTIPSLHRRTVSSVSCLTSCGRHFIMVTKSTQVIEVPRSKGRNSILELD